jgi:hypothetical protein
VILVLPSPPEASDLIPGIERKISAVVLGAALAISSLRSVLTETLELSFERGLLTPVTTTSERDNTSDFMAMVRVVTPPLLRSTTWVVAW